MHPHSHSDDTHAPRKNNAGDSTFSYTRPISGTFPEKLMFILDNEDMYGNTAAWLPNGESFIIRSPKRFSDEVLPHIFRRGCKFNSFMRKLYYWGFKKTKSKEQGSAEFHHKNFRRGSAPSCMHLRALQKSFQRNDNMKSPKDCFDSLVSDGGVSPLSLKEAGSSMIDIKDTQLLRMVRAAMVNYDQKKCAEVISSSRKGHIASPQMAICSPDQLPLTERVQMPKLNFSLKKMHSNAHHLGGGLQGGKDQNPLQTSKSLKAFCNVNNLLLSTYPLSLAPLQGATATSLLTRLSTSPIAYQQNLAQLSPFINNVSALQSLQRM